MLAEYTKMIIFDYYDGELSGIYAEDEMCEVISRFDLLSWDDLQDQRIFCVGRVPNGKALFTEFVQLYSQFENKHWPIWVPKAVPAEKRDEESKLKHDLDSKRQYEFVALGSQFHKGLTKIVPIKGHLTILIQDFIRTGNLQDFSMCRRLMDANES